MSDALQVIRDLLAAADDVLRALPPGEYGGLGAFRAEISVARQFLNRAPSAAPAPAEAPLPSRVTPICDKPGKCPTPVDCRAEGDCLRRAAAPPAPLPADAIVGSFTEAQPLIDFLHSDTAAPARDALVDRLLLAAESAERHGATGATATVLREAAAALAQRDVPREPDGRFYEYDGYFGVHRDFSGGYYNGSPPARVVPYWIAAPQERSDAQRDDDARTTKE